MSFTPFLLVAVLFVQCTAITEPVYVAVGGLDTNSSISVYELDYAGTGTMSFVTTLAGSQAPNFIAWRPGAGVKTLFTANRKRGKQLAAVNSIPFIHSNGTVLATSPQASIAVDDPAHISIHPHGKYAATVSTGQGTLTILALDPSSGLFLNNNDTNNTATTTLPPPTVLPTDQVGNFSHQAKFSPDGNFLYVPCRDSDWIHQYSFDVTTGGTVHDNGKVLVPVGTGPRHMAFHPSLPVAYSVNELGSSVTRFDWDRWQSGQLSANFTADPSRLVSTLAPASVTPPTPACNDTGDASSCPTQTAAEIAVSGDGKFAYVSNRGTNGGANNIAIFKVNSKTGALTPVAWEDAGGDFIVPRHMSLSPGKEGRYLLVSNEQGNSVVVLRRDAATGLLTKTQTVDTSGQTTRPSFIAVLHPETVY